MTDHQHTITRAMAQDAVRALGLDPTTVSAVTLNPHAVAVTTNHIYEIEDAAPDAPRADLTASEGESGAEEGDDAEGPLCPECGHGIDSHGWDGDYALTCCRECDYHGDCRQAPSDIARYLIDLADEWEAGNDG